MITKWHLSSFIVMLINWLSNERSKDEFKRKKSIKKASSKKVREWSKW